jgi:hypothetical protein
MTRRRKGSDQGNIEFPFEQFVVFQPLLLQDYK